MSELAQGWKQSELGSLADVAIGGTPSRDIPRYWISNDVDGKPWVAISDLHGRVIDCTSESITEAGIANSNVKLVKRGTVLMSFKLSLGRVAFAGCDLYTNEAIAAFLVYDQITPTYLYYALPDAVRRAATDVAIKGATLNKKSLRKLIIRHPSPKSQEKIASILSTIDTAIEQTEALIEKYQHIKAGLMHDLFTRGVLPNGQLRPPREQAPELYQETAIGWIPREWQLRHLGEMASIVSGVTLGTKTGPTDTIDAPYLRVANVQDGYLDLGDIKTVRISPKTLEQLRLESGDVLMNEGGDFDKLGRGAVWHGEIENCVHQNHVFRVRCNATILVADYLSYFSESAFGKRYFVLSSKQSTNLASINSTQLKAYPIAVPSLTEQSAITLHVQRAKDRLETLNTEVTNLRSRKLGLMQDLLTGKVPVTVDVTPSGAAA
jgi:type I restriction enzyme S subunit